MAVALTKDSIDLGIIVKDEEAALRFYRDTLGLPLDGILPMPDGGTMHRLRCGSSVIKVISPGKAPPASAPPGGLAGAYGYRYWTISVSNLEEVADACAAAGYKIVMPVREIRTGVEIAMIEDPDGNWVELLRMS